MSHPTEHNDTTQSPDRVLFQHDSALCPSWCAGDHLTEAAEPDWYHDSAAELVLPAPPLPDDLDGAGGLHLVLSQRVNDQGQSDPVHIEMQDSQRLLRPLTPDEAVTLAIALVTATGTARASRCAWRPPSARSRMRTTWWSAVLCSRTVTSVPVLQVAGDGRWETADGHCRSDPPRRSRRAGGGDGEARRRRRGPVAWTTLRRRPRGPR